MLKDEQVRDALREAGWRIGVIWECALKGTGRFDINVILDAAENWLGSSTQLFSIPEPTGALSSRCVANNAAQSKTPVEDDNRRRAD
jgi:hypothetical protein